VNVSRQSVEKTPENKLDRDVEDLKFQQHLLARRRLVTHALQRLFCLQVKTFSAKNCIKLFWNFCVLPF